MVVNSFLLGAAKCGTTTMASWLSQHPDICVSQPKEPRFFIMTENYIKGVDEYVSQHFGHRTNERYVMDCHPYNMAVGFVRDRIYVNMFVHKFVVCVRDPIARAYSDWFQFRSMRPGRETRDFPEAVRENLKIVDVNWADSEHSYELQRDLKGGSYRLTYIENGMYFDQLTKYFARFPKERFGIFLTEDMHNNPHATWDSVCRFMELPTVSIDMSQKNVRLAKDSLWIKKNYPSEYYMLLGHYYDGVMSLGTYLKRDLLKEWWGV